MSVSRITRPAGPFTRPLGRHTRPTRALLALSAFAPFALAGSPADVEPATGPYRAWLESPGGPQIPFRLELEREGDAWSAVVRNAREAIELERVEVADGMVRIHLDPYDSALEARVDPETGHLAGEWTRRRGSLEPTRMSFAAERGREPRFPIAKEPSDAEREALHGRWSVRFSEGEHPAVGIFDVAGDGSVYGTFLTTLGDYRYLEGAFDGSELELSCFDGAHAFLFRAELAAEGTLQGDFWSRDTWHETWTAERDEDAALPDAFDLTRWQSGVPIGELAFPDLDGTERRLDDPAFAGPARLVVLFGSWCPNCNDLTRYLVELEQRFGPRGLKVLGLAFELEDDHEKSAARLRHYRAHHGADYPILIAGPADKRAAGERFPAIDRLRAYPTTLFLDAEGKVRAVHTGFAGPATGDAHERLRERFVALIEELLAEADSEGER